MINSKTFYKIFICIVAVVLLSVIGYYVVYKPTLADSVYGERKNSVVKQVDLDGDGTSEAVILSEYLNGSKITFVLEYQSKVGKLSAKLTGFEATVDFCPDSFVQITPNEKLICLYGAVGAHSQNIQLFKYDGEKLLAVFNTYSDAPRFGYIEANSSSNLELFVDNRNYDLDPTLDSRRTYYYFKDNQFIIDRVEDRRENAESSDQTGAIN